MNERIQKDMSLIVVVLLDDRYLDDVILGITSISGSLVTIIDAVSGTHNLSQAIPMFAEFIGLEGRKFCKVLMAAVTLKDPVSNLLEILHDSGLDFEKKNLGEIYTIPLLQAAVQEELDIYGF